MIAYLCLGSNLADPSKQIQIAVEQIEAVQDIFILRKSGLIETEPYGITDQPMFFNQILEIKTSLAPDALLNRLLDIESQMGRIRDNRWGARIIDIDILLYDDLVINSETLTLPHPDFHYRTFALKLLCKLIPDKIHPILKKSYAEMLGMLEDKEN
ncbi:MAG: 2-amino-4-hydroxy-6-hydroxymethyldihydropteridine diphosphokinase [Candidatus Cloacimonadaceae bacterium]|nr:2-amino-4-hydroxy-6-hydroxymethyldihydropteridine diphosphokinase [Candidatus Cloacimonadaceae bacterium]MDP3115216.1 2-amino-4-hydroxy-6-hydroxymethyldihydropteridine diphosphokinase [Candidatus Cloacimonadaceae bacterium]